MYTGFCSMYNGLCHHIQVYSWDLQPPRWPRGFVGKQFAPPGEPKCGFFGEHCVVNTGKVKLMTSRPCWSEPKTDQKKQRPQRQI